MEVDKTFRSLEEWLKWAHANDSVFNRNAGDEIADRVLASGFVEPLTGRIVSGKEIDRSNRNWREGLNAFGLNSRSRAVLWLIEEHLRTNDRHETCIFATEAVTAFALRLRGHYPRFLGSEYGKDEAAREALFPITHQDLTELSLPSNRFDLITTNEVLEHVPNLDKALREMARILKPGGWHVGTHPFAFMSEVGEVRARVFGNQVVHLKQPEYHGNPVDPQGGSLVFEIPGWDILTRALTAGFSDAHMRFVASERHGFLTENTGVFVLCAQK